MTKLPGAMFIADIQKDEIALNEAKRLDVPIIAILDTNSNPDGITYPIPGNDDSYKSIELITRVISDAIIETSIKESVPAEAAQPA
jgi:small subunit ribosomal protein S2